VEISDGISGNVRRERSKCIMPEFSGDIFSFVSLHSLELDKLACSKTKFYFSYHIISQKLPKREVDWLIS